MRERATHSERKSSDDQLRRIGAPEWARRAIQEAQERRGNTAHNCPRLARAKVRMLQAQAEGGWGSQK